jgi:hypothetical protein
MKTDANTYYMLRESSSGELMLRTVHDIWPLQAK